MKIKQERMTEVPTWTIPVALFVFIASLLSLGWTQDVRSNYERKAQDLQYENSRLRQNLKDASNEYDEIIDKWKRCERRHQ